MPRNRVQQQKGLWDDTFERLYPDEEACRKAWFAWRWPEGFKCPRCAAAEYCEIRERQLLQCRCCRYQSSLIAGTVLQGTKLPMRVWFRAMHLLAEGKKGLSNIELGRRLGVSTNAAWRVQHKLMQAMIERDRRYPLGAAGPRIEMRIGGGGLAGERRVASGRAIGDGIGISLASLRRFWAVAARWNSSRAPFSPRHRSRSSFRMRLRWANSISTFLRSTRARSCTPRSWRYRVPCRERPHGWSAGSCGRARSDSTCGFSEQFSQSSLLAR